MNSLLYYFVKTNRRRGLAGVVMCALSISTYSLTTAAGPEVVLQSYVTVGRREREGDVGPSTLKAPKWEIIEASLSGLTDNA